ncbi:hypothetical protein EDB19DRAFT_66768 [Suillus lakei]|nr:hypothetical protein EDB19DRAFT_66768 [Suillus lakei]
MGDVTGQNCSPWAMYLAYFVGALHMMAGKIGKKGAARNAAVHTNVHLGEPEEPNRFGLILDPLRLRVRTRMRNSFRSATRCVLLTRCPREFVICR